MNSNEPEYKQNVINNMTKVRNMDLLPWAHYTFLEEMKDGGFSPKVCYDIGSCVLHWTRHAERIWPGVKCVLFDAFEPAEMFYGGYDYTMGVLSDSDGKEVRFYQNDLLFGGNSYYREVGCSHKVFPEDTYLVKTTRSLDSIVREKGYPYPDLIKIDVQGAELDILKGAQEVLNHAKCIIVELQDVEYNQGAPLCDVTIGYLESIGWECTARKFSDNGPDGDYCFVKKTRSTLE
jgi:FkbM family methyltransferase